MSKFSLNNKVVTEVYVKEELRKEVRGGIVMVSQKSAIKSLKVLMDAKLNDGTIIKAGSFVGVKENDLHSKEWARKSYECSELLQPFMLINLTEIEFVIPPEGMVL